MGGSKWVVQWVKTTQSQNERNNSCAGFSMLNKISLISLEQNEKLYHFGHYEFILGLFETMDHASHFENFVI